MPTSISKIPSQIGIQPLTQQPPNLIPLTTTPPPLRQQHTNTHHSTAQTGKEPGKGRERRRPGLPSGTCPADERGRSGRKKSVRPTRPARFSQTPAP